MSEAIKQDGYFPYAGFCTICKSKVMHLPEHRFLGCRPGARDDFIAAQHNSNGNEYSDCPVGSIDDLTNWSFKS